MMTTDTSSFQFAYEEKIKSAYDALIPSQQQEIKKVFDKIDSILKKSHDFISASFQEEKQAEEKDNEDEKKEQKRRHLQKMTDIQKEWQTILQDHVSSQYRCLMDKQQQCLLWGFVCIAVALAAMLVLVVGATLGFPIVGALLNAVVHPHVDFFVFSGLAVTTTGAAIGLFAQVGRIQRMTTWYDTVFSLRDAVDQEIQTTCSPRYGI